jgi:hypothetical protein
MVPDQMIYKLRGLYPGINWYKHNTPVGINALMHDFKIGGSVSLEFSFILLVLVLILYVLLPELTGFKDLPTLNDLLHLVGGLIGGLL